MSSFRSLKWAPLVVGLMGFAAGQAQASAELAQSKACLACHGVDKKLVGPALMDVAKKYKGDKNAVDLLSESIKKGGVGKWGQVPMPAQAALSDAEVKTLATWVMSLGK